MWESVYFFCGLLLRVKAPGFPLYLFILCVIANRAEGVMWQSHIFNFYFMEITASPDSHRDSS